MLVTGQPGAFRVDGTDEQDADFAGHCEDPEDIWPNEYMIFSI
jgi:hypothetical protein